MKLKIKSIADPGMSEKERLAISVLADDDVGKYAVFCSEKSVEGATAGNKTAYWFPDVKVSAGDVVILYTKAGADSNKQLESGGVAHFFYWGLPNPLWGRGNAAVLLNIIEWEMATPSPRIPEV